MSAFETIRIYAKAPAKFVRDMYSHRELLASFVKRDLTSKYRGTFIGFFWNVINPLVMLALYTFVFSVILQVKFGEDGTTSNFALYLFSGMVPWLAFSESVGRATSIIVTHQNLVKKTVFPLEILPFYPILSNTVTECISLAILLVAVLVVIKQLSMFLLMLPFLILLQILFTLGFAFFFASLCIFFRDVTHLVGVLLIVWMFLTPIFYPATLIPEEFKFVVWLNPMALLVGMFRTVVLEGAMPQLWEMGVFSAWAVVVFCGGLFFFKKTKLEFADVI